MIGGRDIVSDCAVAPKTAFLEAVRVAESIWPSLLVEDGDTGALIGPEDFKNAREVMIYKNRKSLDSWDDEGASPANRNTMIHILTSKKSVTVVIDNETHPDMKRFVAEFGAALSQPA